jgi:hypothetical protein
MKLILTVLKKHILCKKAATYDRLIEKGISVNF